jgi:hypothetical protein
MEPSELRPPRPQHPFAAKGRALVSLVSAKVPEIRQVLEIWLEDGLCGGWYHTQNGNPGDLALLLDRQMEPRPAPLRPAWPVQFRIGLTFEWEQTQPTVHVLVSLVPKFSESDFEHSTPTQVLQVAAFLSNQARWAMKVEKVLRDACGEIGILVR